MGVTDGRTSSAEYDDDMQQAKAAGIDAFALNIGTDGFTSNQLGFAYTSADNNGMSVFLSFDFSLYSTSNISGIAQTIADYSQNPAQLTVDSKVFVSSFQGDGLDLDAVQTASGSQLFWAPNFQYKNVGSADSLHGLLNWMAWPNNGNNKAPDSNDNVTVSEGDVNYKNALNGKFYIAPVSAWFSTHFGLEVPYSKNWVFPSDLLWFDRWTEILTLGSQYIEILSWNDYGESHYIGPLSSPHIDDGNSKWTNDMPHDGFLSMAKPYIAAFHAGSLTVDNHIEFDQLIYWYRPTAKSASCDTTDNCGKPWPSPSPNSNYFVGKPNGYDTVDDSVFVVALLKSAGVVQIASGGNSQTFNAPAGASSFQVNMAIGKQSFSLIRDGQTVLCGESLKEIISECVCGIYNFNAYVGTLPAGFSGYLQADGLSKFTSSLLATCSPTPSLATAPGSGTGCAAPQTAVGTDSFISSFSGVTTAASSSPSTTGTPAPVSQTPTAVSTTPTIIAGDGSKTITALSQLSPSNCMHTGYVWAGAAGSDPPAYCDG